jgi:hypothetical protein
MRMEAYSHSNMFILHFGQDHITKAIPVHERVENHAYELPMRRSEKRIMLQKCWKLEPPLNKAQQTKQVFHGNQEKLSYWCKYHKSWTIHSPLECRKQHSGRNKSKRNAGKPRSTYRQPVRGGINNNIQSELHSNPRTEQNKFKASDKVHMPSKAREVKVKKKWRHYNASREVLPINPQDHPSIRHHNLHLPRT